VDTATNPFVSLKKGGIEPNEITDLVLTHFHPDHVSGLPILVMGMWFTGRKLELHIHGLEYTLERAKKMLDLFNISAWLNLFPIHYHTIPELESGLAPIISEEDFVLFGAKVNHLIPTLGIRAEFPKSGKVLAYSCDTEPCVQVIRLAAGADVLIHEASGALPGHSSARQAGEAATQAKVGALYLIHYPTGQFAMNNLLSDAQEEFSGPVIMAQDGTIINFD
jgi:ribonuclease Z